jgi:hypothetical protein
VNVPLGANVCPACAPKVIVWLPAPMVADYACEPVKPNPSVAVTVKLYVPEAVGVPDSTPALLNAIPGGNAPAVSE